MAWADVSDGEDQAWVTAQQTVAARQAAAAQATPDQAIATGTLAAGYPQVFRPGVLQAFGVAQADAFAKMRALGIGPTIPDEQLAAQLNALSDKDLAYLAKRSAGTPRKHWWTSNPVTHAIGTAVGTAARTAGGQIPEPVRDAAKATSRVVSSAASTPLQIVQTGLVRNVEDVLSGDIGGADRRKREGRTGWSPRNPIRDTSLYQLAQHPSDAGSGFFLGGTAEEKRRQAEADYRGTFTWVDANGEQRTQTNTLGRSIARRIPGVQPGDTAFHLLSGAADAAVAWYGDPLNHVGHAARDERLARDTLLPALEKVEPAAAGALDGYTKSVHGKLAEEFLQSGKGRAVIERIAVDDSPSSIFSALGRNIDPTIAVQLAEADTPEKVATVLRGHIGLDPGLTSAKAVAKAGNAFDRTSPFGTWLARQGAKMYAPVLAVGSPTSPLSRAEMMTSVRTMDDYLATMKAPIAERRDILDRFVRGLADGTESGVKQATDAAFSVFERQMVANGIEPMLAREIARYTGDLDSFVRRFGVDALGHNDDGGLLKALIASKAGELGLENVDLTAISPLLLSEGLSGFVPLPEARLVKRMTGTLGKMMAVTAVDTKAARTIQEAEELVKAAAPAVGRLKAPLAAIDFLSTEVWKPATVMRIATVFRVVGEEQLRIAEHGGVSLFRHPLQFIMLSSGKVGGESMIGESWSRKTIGQVLDAGDSEHLHSMADYTEAMNNGPDRLFARGGDARFMQRSVRQGTMNVIFKADEAHRPMWLRGLADEMGRLHADPIAREIASGRTNAEVIDWLRSPAGDHAYKRLIARGESGVIRMEDGVRRSLAADYRNEAELDALISSTRKRIEKNVGDNADLRKVIAEGKFGTHEAEVGNKELRVVKAGPREPVDAGGFGSGKTRPSWVGDTVVHPDYGVGVVTAEAGDGRSVVRFDKFAYANGEPTPELRAALSDWHKAPESPDAVTYAERIGARTGRDARSNARSVAMGWDKATDWFFGSLWGNTTDSLSRSPYFRQHYYSKVADLVPYLSVEEQNAALKKLTALGADTHLAPKSLKRAVEAASKGVAGKLTLADIDGYAKGYALDQVKALLYDTAEKSQFADAARVVAPFAEAWKEVIQRQAKLIAGDPTILRRAQMAVHGAESAGFFYTDPTSGQEVFTYPFTKQMLAPLGVNALMGGRAKGLSIGLDVTPGIGPAMQLPLSFILPNTPKYDDVAALLFPFGRPTGSPADRLYRSTVPSWAQKVMDATFGSKDANTTYGNTYVDVVRALAASGKYGTDVASQQQMIDDAAHKAKTLTILRGLAQWVVPSAPRYDYEIATKQGDIIANTLAQAYQHLITEDPTTATAKFLDLYGEQAMAYATAKSVAQAGGLDNSSRFGQWERGHDEAFRRYKDVAGYFAPIGDDFSFAVYQRQLETGKRRKLTGAEMAAAINSKIARAQYAELRAQFPADLTDEQSAALKKVKEELAKKYAGYEPFAPFDVNKFSRQVEQLQAAANDPTATSDSPVAGTIKSYLDFRDEVLAIAASRGNGIGAKGNGDLRAVLAEAGAALVESEPLFGRVWDGVLSQEVED